MTVQVDVSVYLLRPCFARELLTTWQPLACAGTLREGDGTGAGRKVIGPLRCALNIPAMKSCSAPSALDSRFTGIIILKMRKT